MSTAVALSPDRVEIARALRVLHPDDGVIELRALYQRGKKRTAAGYFDGAHRDQLVEEAAMLNERGAAVYVVMNPLDEQLLGRYANRIEDYAADTATDANIVRRSWLLIDIDPQRPKATSASAEQVEAAMDRARKVYRTLTERGWPKPVVAESGNGAHLLYRIDLPNDDASRDLVKGCLEALAAKFDGQAVKIDRSVFNAARIVKLHGTVANKGDHLSSTPWRLSRLRSVPDRVETVSREFLQVLAAEAPSAGPKPHGIGFGACTDASTDRAWTETDLSDFLRRGALEVLGEPAPHDGTVRWKLKRCPFNPDHVNGEAAVFQLASGALGFKCQHSSCADRHWADLRELVDGPRRAQQSTRFAPPISNRGASAPARISQHSEGDPGRVILVAASDIRMRPVSWLWPGWLAGGKLHILGGVPGTGKTTIALGVAATLTTGGRWPDGSICGAHRNVMIWSGEDSADDTLVPRLAAARADLSRVKIVSAVSHEDGRRPFDPSRDMAGLIEAAQAIGDVGLLMLDPVVMTVQGDSHKNAEVRRGLQPIVDFAERLNAAALGITHFSKGTAGRDPLDRITGSLAFGAAPRLVWAAAKEFDDDGKETGRVLARLKSNIGPDGGGVRYSFLQTEPEPGVMASTVLWGEIVEGTAREILGQPDVTGDDPEEISRGKARIEAESFLRDLLMNGPVAVETVREEAKKAGMSWRTIERAKPDAGVRATKLGFAGGWGWALIEASKTANSSEDRHYSEEMAVLGSTAENPAEIPAREPKTAGVGRVEETGGLRRAEVAVLGAQPDGAEDF